MCEKSSTPQIDGAIMNNGNSLQHVNGSTSPEDNKKVELRKKVTLLRGISIIVGIIIGAGIFISPKGILQNLGSIRMSLIVWISCGVLSLFGELVLRCWNTSIFDTVCTWKFFHWMLIRCWWRCTGQSRLNNHTLNTCRRGGKSKKRIHWSHWCPLTLLKLISFNLWECLD